MISQKNKPGPKPTGWGAPVLTRLQPGLLAQIDGWRGDMTRPEAIRRLIEMALNTEK